MQVFLSSPICLPNDTVNLLGLGGTQHTFCSSALCLSLFDAEIWNASLSKHTQAHRFLWRLCQLLCLVRGQWSLYYLCTGVSLIMWLRACRAKASVKVSVQCERSTRDWINMSYVAIRSALGLVCVKRVLYSWVSVCRHCISESTWSEKHCLPGIRSSHHPWNTSERNRGPVGTLGEPRKNGASRVVRRWGPANPRQWETRTQGLDGSEMGDLWASVIVALSGRLVKFRQKIGDWVMAFCGRRPIRVVVWGSSVLHQGEA